MAAFINTICKINFKSISNPFTKKLPRKWQETACRYYASSKTDEDTTDHLSPDVEFGQDEDEIRSFEEQIDKLRDVSRLPTFKPHLKTIVRGEMPDLNNPFFLNRKMQGKMYAMYGKSSGIDPRSLWPKKEHLMEQIEEDKVFEPPLHEKLEQEYARQEKTRKAQMAWVTKIEGNMENMATWIGEYRDKIRKNRFKVRRAQLRKEDLKEYAREQYGYRLSNKDPKFRKIAKDHREELKEKIKAERKEKKQQKKQKRQAMIDKATSFEQFLDPTNSSRKNDKETLESDAQWNSSSPSEESNNQNK